MDVLCDTLLLEEILPRMEPKSLIRLGATSRRYNALARSPGFTSRYWTRAGVFFQPAAEHREGALPSAPRFLTAPARQAADHVPVLDLAKDGIMVIVHSAAGGLLLCSWRLPTRLAACYCVFNPVTRQLRALPELRGLCYKPQCGLLTVDATRFQVVVIEEWQFEDMFLDLKVFSSDTGRWKAKHLSLSMSSHPSLPFEHDFRKRPALGPSGTAYWIQRDGDEAIAFHGATSSLRVIHLPMNQTAGRPKCCIGERRGGGGLRFARVDASGSALEVWDSETMEGSAWALAHRVGIAELLGQSSDDAAWHRRCIKPVGFHPTDVDVVFLALPAGVAAYSMEHGTMDLQCTHDFFAAPADVFPYVHPPYPVQIPAVKNLALEPPRKRRKADHDTYSSKNGGGIVVEKMN